VLVEQVEPHGVVRAKTGPGKASRLGCSATGPAGVVKNMSPLVPFSEVLNTRKGHQHQQRQGSKHNQQYRTFAALDLPIRGCAQASAPPANRPTALAGDGEGCVRGHAAA